MTDRGPAETARAIALRTFQSRVNEWMQVCFGEEIGRDKLERNRRFLEESLELVQANGCSQREAHQLVDYVFGREVGQLTQEVGGVMVTLASLCEASDIDMVSCGRVELERIWTKIEEIRAKHATKPKDDHLRAERREGLTEERSRSELAAQFQKLSGAGTEFQLARFVQQNLSAIVDACKERSSGFRSRRGWPAQITFRRSKPPKPRPSG